jgi:hypothetical protein
VQRGFRSPLRMRRVFFSNAERRPSWPPFCIASEIGNND